MLGYEIIRDVNGRALEVRHTFADGHIEIVPASVTGSENPYLGITNTGECVMLLQVGATP
jgi:hypothetical protein